MKSRSSSQLPYKRFPSTDSLKIQPLQSHRHNPLSKQQPLSARKNSLWRESKDKSLQKNSSIFNTNPKPIYDLGKELQHTQSIRKGVSLKYINGGISNRPSTSNKSSTHLLPKLHSDRNRLGEDGILILSQLPGDYLLKREEKARSFVKRVDIGIETQGNIEEKKKKLRLKYNLGEELIMELKKSFKVRILKGKLEFKSAEILNFKKTLPKQAEKVDRVLSIIDRFTRRYNLKENYEISYQSFEELLSNPKPSNRDIVVSFNLDELPEELVPIPGAEFAEEDGVDKAVVKIQSVFKMWQERRGYIHYQGYMDKIKFIQRYWRTKVLIVQTRKRLKDIRLEKIERFRQIQKDFQDKWYMTKNKKRWEIHIPNMGICEFSKLTTQKLVQQQCSQLLRIFKIAHDFLVNVVFISPIPLSQDVLDYYYKVFQINNMVEWGSRVKFIYPENYSKFSSSISISRLLLQSPMALSKLKSIIGGGSAYIVSGQNSNNSDIHLALELNIPIFGSPFASQPLTTYSGILRLLNECRIPSTLIARDIYSQEELVNTLGVLMFNNIEIERWTIKMDDQYDGRGDATIHISSFPMVRALLKSFREIRDCDEAYDLEEDVVKALAEQLKESNHRRIKIANKAIYRNSKEYFKALFKKGAVIQKGIEGEEVHISFMIYPDREIEVVHAMKIVRNGGRVLAAISPIQRETYSQCQYTAKALGKELIKKDIFGMFSIEIIYNVIEEKYYCTGLKTYIDPTSSYAYLSGLVNSVSVPHQVNQPQNYTIYCPIVLHQGICDQTFKGFFQKSRYSNIQFDVKTKEGVLFLPQDSLQSQCLGIMAVSSNYYSMLSNLMQGFQFLIKEFGQGKQKRKEGRMSVSASKSKIKLMMNQLMKGSKPQPNNLEWLF